MVTLNDYLYSGDTIFKIMYKLYDRFEKRSKADT